MKDGQSINEIKIQEAEMKIRSGQYSEAISLLREVGRAEPDNGRAAFDLGNIAMFQGEPSLALKYYRVAEKRGSQLGEVYQNMAAAKESLGQQEDAEKLYLKAYGQAETKQEFLLILTAQVLFYMRNDRMLRAEKTAKQAIEKFPEEYQGHHLYYLVLISRKRFGEIFGYFEKISSRFSENPQYLTDLLAALKLAGREQDILEKIEKMPVMMEQIPRLALRERANLMLKQDKRTEGERDIAVLFEKYGDLDAAFSVVVLEMLKGNYIQAGAIANWILKQEYPNYNFRACMTMYLQIFILYLKAEGNPDEDTVKLMEMQADLCTLWLEKHGLAKKELYETLNLVMRKR